MGNISKLCTLILVSTIMVLLCEILPAQAEFEDCVSPVEPYSYNLHKSDPLYEEARMEYQTYLQELEAYSLCLDRQRAQVFETMKRAFETYQYRFKEDAYFKYEPN